MWLNASADLAASVIPKYNPPRLQLRIGPAYRFTLTDAEAISLAAQLAGMVDNLRAKHIRRTLIEMGPQQ